MTLLATAFEARATKSTTNPQSPAYWAQKLFGGASSSATGVSVTPDSAMQAVAVWACVRVLSDTMASLPLHVYRWSGGGKQIDPTHPLYLLLHDQPNDWQTSYEWGEMMAGHLELRGNAYSEIISTKGGEIVALIPLHPDRVTVAQDGGKYMKIQGQLVYEYRPGNGAPRYIFQEDMHHLRGFSFDGVTGLSPIAEAREAVGLALATEGYGARFFGNDASPSGVLEHPGQLSDEARKNIHASWEARHKGVDNSHKYALLEEGLKWQSIGLSSQDAQFLETRKFQRNEIASFFRVPPHMIGDLERATFSNIEHQDIGFAKHTMRPRCVRSEQALARDLLSESDRRTHTIKYNLDGLMRGDLKSRYDAYAIGRQNGILSGDEIRALEDMNPMPDDQGKIYLAPLNTIPLELVGQGLEKKPAEGRAMEKRVLEFREQRSVIARQRLKGAHKPLFEGAVGRYLKREIDRVRRAVKTADTTEGQAAFLRWLDEFYPTQQDYIGREMLPIVSAYAAAVQREAAEEVGVEVVEMGTFVREYNNALAEREAAKSANQLRNLVLDSPSTEVPALIGQRLDEWTEGRAAKVAFRETVRMAGAVALETYRTAGRTEIKWKTTGGSCPLCNKFDGRVVGIEEHFAVPGDKVEAEGVEPLVVQHHVRHPQLHKGCDCNIAAA